MTRVPLVLLLAVAACGAPATETSEAAAPLPVSDELATPSAVILFIGDGTGINYWSAAKTASDAPLAIESFPVVGLVDTESANSRITDSAAGATAFATGVRTYNGAIGVAADSTPVPTVLELAEERGWATGLVATSDITHATPASFAAHVLGRSMQRAIAEQLATAGVDVLLGGGRAHFRGTYEDAPAGLEDLLPGLARSGAYVEDAAALNALQLDTVRSLVGLFAETHPGPAPQRSPTLTQLTNTALDVLRRDEDGFFLMVEGSQADWRGHENAPLGEVLAEVRDLDQAVRAALEFQRERPGTLVIVTADHSTGGFALHPDTTGTYAAHYTTDYHTVGMVPLFARGPGAQYFGGVRDNDEVGRLLLQIVRDGGGHVAP